MPVRFFMRSTIFSVIRVWISCSDSGASAAHKAIHREPKTRFLLISRPDQRSEEHTSELQSLMRSSYAVFCLKNKKKTSNIPDADAKDTEWQTKNLDKRRKDETREQ